MQALVVQCALDILECRFNKLPETILLSYFLFGPGRFARSPHLDLEGYRFCMRNKLQIHKGASKNTKYKLFRSRIKECLPFLTQQCEKHHIGGFKTIRMSTDLIHMILTKDPSIKVIYSTRDPRAIVSSRIEID